jgi:hypothetical protein
MASSLPHVVVGRSVGALYDQLCKYYNAAK